jgi:hypothetical protein
VLITYPSGHASAIEWQGDGRLILPTLHAAKRYAAEAIADLQRHGYQADVQATNWTSVTAALQVLIEDWNTTQRATLRLNS